MLQHLHVKNLALIRKAEIDFTEGLNILTGETGAGKSIVIGSMVWPRVERYQSGYATSRSGLRSGRAVFFCGRSTDRKETGSNGYLSG